MISERSRAQWVSYVAARLAESTPFGDRDELHRFLVGIHLRGEQLTAPELRELLDLVSADAVERDTLTEFIEGGLALLQSYDRLVDGEDSAYSNQVDGGFHI